MWADLWSRRVVKLMVRYRNVFALPHHPAKAPKYSFEIVFKSYQVCLSFLFYPKIDDHIMISSTIVNNPEFKNNCWRPQGPPACTIKPNPRPTEEDVPHILIHRYDWKGRLNGNYFCFFWRYPSLPHQRKRHPTLKQTKSLHMFLCPPSSQIKSLMEIWEVINRINTQSFGRGYSHGCFQNLTIAKIGFNPPSLNSGTLGGFDDKKCVNATRKS